MFVGIGHKFQIWEPVRFQARLTEARQRRDAVASAACNRQQWTIAMTAQPRPARAVADGPAGHRPVLLDEAMAALKLRSGGRYLDGTFGAGGYTRTILAHSGTRVIALDRDPVAIAGGAKLVAEAGPALTLCQARFGTLDETALAQEALPLDGVVLDIGVSSMQLDEEKRGFSFRTDGPLDMRMEKRGPSAADLVNTADETTLANILYTYGEEARLAPHRPRDRARPRDHAFHPHQGAGRPDRPGQSPAWASRNPPCDPQLPGAADRGERRTRRVAAGPCGGRTSACAGADGWWVVTFHSLEDRIVKRFLTARSGRSAAETRSRHLPPAETAGPRSFTLDGRQTPQRHRPGDREQPARPLRQAPGRDPHRRPASSDRAEPSRACGPSRHDRQDLSRCGAFSTVLAMLILVGSAGYAYGIKYETILFAEQIIKTKHEIADETDAIARLHAEWALLTRPERIQTLAEQHTSLRPLALNQIVGLADLPKPARPRSTPSGASWIRSGLASRPTPPAMRPGTPPRLPRRECHDG